MSNSNREEFNNSLYPASQSEFEQDLSQMRDSKKANTVRVVLLYVGKADYEREYANAL